MRIGGVDPASLSNEVVLVLPRKGGQLVFRARALKDWDEFNALCPQPLPSKKMVKGGVIDDYEAKSYKDAMGEYGRRKTAYLVVKSLEPSEIEWDTVKMDVPGSWVNWSRDLTEAGIGVQECNHVFNLAMEANALDEAKLKAARDFFLLGQAILGASSGQSTEQETSPSGEPVVA